MAQRADSCVRFIPRSHPATQYYLLPEDRRILAVLQAIEADPSHSIAALACQVNLSTSRLSHLFKAQTGVSLQSVLTSRRMETALELLRTTPMAIKEISYCTGYRHAPSFVRAFRNEFGASPSRYRPPAGRANE
jgi:AraC family transcriptional regulator of arabinose operon